MPDEEKRQRLIIDTLVDAFADLMEADANAFRVKFRKMAADPWSFYRGSACVFYADMAEQDDRWSSGKASRVWIQGDLHAENFGTYMDGRARSSSTSTTSTRPTWGRSRGTCGASWRASPCCAGRRRCRTR